MAANIQKLRYKERVVWLLIYWTPAKIKSKSATSSAVSQSIAGRKFWMGREPSVVLGFWHYHCYERYILQRFEKLLAPEKEDKSIFDKSKKLGASVVDATRDLVPGTNFGELLGLCRIYQIKKHSAYEIKEHGWWWSWSFYSVPGTTVFTWYLVRDTREYQVHGMIAHQQ